MANEAHYTMFEEIIEDVQEGGKDSLTKTISALMNVAMKGDRSERALKLAIAEMYIQGVSTRRVSKIVEVLCGFEVSQAHVSDTAKLLDVEIEKWRSRPLGAFRYMVLDATYEKVRMEQTVVSGAVLIAYGVDNSGKRRVLGISTEISEAEVHWRAFLKSLVDRGLHGVEMITSDAHEGLKAGRTAIFRQ